jgi:hypothetical protein
MRRIGMLLAALLVAVAAAHGAAWWLLGSAVVASIDGAGPDGERVHHDGLARGGWPWRAGVTIVRPELHRPATGFLPAMTLAAVGAEAGVQLASPREATVTLRCPCRVTFPARPGAAPADIEAGALVLSFRVEPGASPRRWQLDGEEVTIVQAGEAVQVASLRLTGERDEAARSPRQIVAVTLGGVRLGPAAEVPFGRVIRTATGEAVVSGALPPGPDTEASLRAWRADDGRIELRRVAIAWGPLALSAGATLALDHALQPMGAGTIRIANWRPALDAVGHAGLIDRQALALVRLALTAVARPAPGGGSMVELPVALEQRTLTAARIPIARLPEIAWPRGPSRLGSN